MTMFFNIVVEKVQNDELAKKKSKFSRIKLWDEGNLKSVAMKLMYQQNA